KPAIVGYTIGQNGLVQPWFGSVWLNPPYSAPGEFCAAPPSMRRPASAWPR
ncbi:unnamed protein product, partial [marine sediment metagenome]